MYRGAVIGDLHYGVPHGESIHDEFEDIFMYYVQITEELDFIIIDGDWFDSKLYLNDASSVQAINDMRQIFHIAMDRKLKVRIIYGTESHDSNQYKVFNSYLLNKKLDLKIIYQVEEEELFPDFHVLYIPEEHIYDKREYYSSYFKNKNKYDFVFGHGIIQEAMTYIKRDSGKKSERLKVPVFTTAELGYICKGLVVFGHYHIHTNIDDKVFYVGSFSRWQHGEEEPKGFMEIEKDDDGNYNELFINNPHAPEYITFKYDQSSNIFDLKSNYIKEIDKLYMMVENKFCDNIKLVIQIPMNFEDKEYITQYTKDKFKFKENVIIDISSLDENIKDKSQKEKIQEIIDKYSCIFDKSAPVEEKISYFLKINKDKNISIEKINFYLNRDLKN